MTKKRMKRSFTATRSGRWRSSRALVCQLLFRIWHCCRSPHYGRNHAHNLLPRSLVESKCDSQLTPPCPVLICWKILKITRTKRNKDYGHSSELKIRWAFASPPLDHLRRQERSPYGIHSVVARNNNILKQLVLEAKREYEKDAEHKVHIYMADT